jgi:hypothetical protein
LQTNSYSVENDDGHDQLYVLIRHDLLANHQRHHACSYDGDDADVDADVDAVAESVAESVAEAVAKTVADADAGKRGLAVLQIQVQKERRQHWQSADQSL